jgi:hypothetical protein
MDERRTDPPHRPPVARAGDLVPTAPPGPPFPPPAEGPPGASSAPPGAGPPSDADRPHRPSRLARLVRSPRGAAGLAIVVAALLLWPFSGWAAIPWLVGLAVLVLLRLLRLDGLLRGWAPHLAGIAVVAGLLMSTSPWAWALAASSGVLLAGLVQLPAWRLAALGGALCVVSGAAFAWDQVRDAREAAANYAPIQERSRADQGAPRPDGVLPILLNRIAQGSPDAICDALLAEPARAPFAASVGAPDCDGAVASLAARVTDPGRYADADAPRQRSGDVLTVDACALTWSGSSAGPQLGRLTISAIAPNRYVVTGFRAC